jgi:hypothetical protein
MSWQKLVAALVAVGLLALAVSHLRSDRRQIHRQLAALTDLLSKEGPSDTLQDAAIAQRVTTHFTPQFLVSAQPYQRRIRDLRELAAAVHRFRSAGERIEIGVRDRALELRSNDTAVLHFVATVTLHRSERPSRESYRVRTQWQKDEGRWTINQLELLEILEGPGNLTMPW